ncbi:hypothetical protein BG000_004742, partial [Podila horticola]
KYTREFLSVEDNFDGDSCQSASDIQPEDESPMEEVRATIPSTSLVPLFFINLRYILLFAVSLFFVTCLVYAYMPWRDLFLAIVLAVVFVLPVGIVQAVTNQQPSLNIYAASIVWGAIEPARVFGSKDHAIYAPVQWDFLAGALLPIPFWFASRRWPHIRWLKHVHWPVFLAATSNIPPALPYFFANGLFCR